MMRSCPVCGAILGPWEDARGCRTCLALHNYSIADHVVGLMEGISQPLAYWDISRLLRAQGLETWEPTLKTVLGTDPRLCWAGAGIYGLFRHGLLPRVRNLARVGVVFLYAAGEPMRPTDLAFVLRHVGYRFNDLSLRYALRRSEGMGLAIEMIVDGYRMFLPTQSAIVSAGLGLPEGTALDSIVERTRKQLAEALAELDRRSD